VRKRKKEKRKREEKGERKGGRGREERKKLYTNRFVFVYSHSIMHHSWVVPAPQGVKRKEERKKRERGEGGKGGDNDLGGGAPYPLG